ncbi:MAG: FtsW/RodA/SpoVE family cell cycle protein [Bacilli bacterium]
MKQQVKLIDWKILLPVLLLTGYGLVMIYSSTMVLEIFDGRPVGSAEQNVKKQFMFTIISIFMMFLSFFIMGLKPLREDKKRAFLAFLFFILSTGLVAITFLFEDKNGAHGWIEIRGSSFQPIELVKLATIIYLSSIIATKKNYLSKPIASLRAPFILLALLLLIVLKLPDFGGVIILLGILYCLLLISGINLKKVTALFGFGVFSISTVTLLMLYTPLFPAYQVGRFTSFLDPTSDATGASMQLLNSMQAFINGGWFGSGLGMSIQKYGYLPEAHNDFILAIVAEELGIVGLLVVIILLGIIIHRIFQLSKATSSLFYSLVSAGIGFWFAIQALVNFGGVTGALPLTGVTFPFFSSGGSSILCLYISIGILLYISYHTRKEHALRKTVESDQKPIQKDRNIPDIEKKANNNKDNVVSFPQ